MLKKLFLIIAVGSFIVPSISTASPVYYTATGSFPEDNGTTLSIIGGMYIDDQLRTWDGYAGQPTQVDSNGMQYQYYITDYSLKVGQDIFSGDHGHLYMEIVSNYRENDLMWFFEDGSITSRWDRWIGEIVIFYDDDGMVQTPYQYLSSLANIVNLQMPYLYENYNGFNLWLTRGDSAPVPEPSILALLGAGFVGTIIQKKRNRSNKANYV